jgi:hypothetical protein
LRRRRFGFDLDAKGLDAFQNTHHLRCSPFAAATRLYAYITICPRKRRKPSPKRSSTSPPKADGVMDLRTGPIAVRCWRLRHKK